MAGLWKEVLDAAREKMATAYAIADLHPEAACRLLQDAIADSEVVVQWAEMEAFIEEREYLARARVYF